MKLCGRTPVGNGLRPCKEIWKTSCCHHPVGSACSRINTNEYTLERLNAKVTLKKMDLLVLEALLYKRVIPFFRSCATSSRRRPECTPWEWMVMAAAGFSPPGIPKQSSAKLCGTHHSIRVSTFLLICRIGVRSGFPP